MIHHDFIDEYIQSWKTGKIELNKEQIKLIAHIEKDILTRDDLYFDYDQIDAYVKFSEKFFFPLAQYQRFITPFIFLYEKETGDPYYDEFFITLGRGGGKNGWLSTLGAYFISDYHGIDNYDISIVANSEDQAKTSFDEIYNMIDKHHLDDIFYNKMSVIKNYDTRSRIRYRTSNANTKDGGREGAIFYDEIHEYVDSEVIDVFSGGLGKVKHSREFKIGTNGDVREGYYDMMMDRAMAILNGEVLEDRLFPFIAKLDEADEMKDESKWPKANPMLNEKTPYARQLMRKVRTQFKKLDYEPSGRVAFMTKRMNFPEEDPTITIAPYDQIQAASREFPNLDGHTAIIGLDYASIRDFLAVGLLFKVGDEYIWKTHSFARREYVEQVKLKPPIKEWEKEGFLTLVDDETIDPDYALNWVLDQIEKHNYKVRQLVADNFRADLVKKPFEKKGFDVEVIRNPKGIHAKIHSIIEDGFAHRKFNLGLNPLMRWYVQNVAVKVKADGNREYIKKDQHRRKTDGFHAFLYALYKSQETDETNIGESMDLLDEMLG